jgi:hypothetical protein
MNPVPLVLQQSAFDEHVAVVIHGYAQQYSVVDVELRRSAIPVQHWVPSEAIDGVSRQQTGVVVSLPESGALQESPASQQSAAEVHLSPGTGQQAYVRPGLPPQTVPLH